MKTDLLKCDPIMKADNRHHKELHKQIEQLEELADPIAIAELFGVKRKITKNEGIAYVAGFVDGRLVGSFAQYLSSRPEGWMKNLEKAERKFHGRKIKSH